jgi:CRISPR-associated endonuclease/helicase Cas3
MSEPFFPTFQEFVSAIDGREPFPWQKRLADDVMSTGWPREIGVATGLGKTTCIDIAVWTLARQASLGARPRTLPTRIWYVVDRRLLVDAAYDRGCRLANLLGTPEELSNHRTGASDADIAAVRAVAHALQQIAALGVHGAPLHVARLRGGAALGERSPDPSQPALLFATVPMYASRLLFRGYGTSASMRPVDAALAGTDALVLLDEAHLARPLLSLCTSVRRHDLGDASRLLPQRRAAPAVVSLTATGDSGARFDLDAEDHDNATVRRRLDAAKPTTMVATTRADLAATMSAQVTGLMSALSGSAGIVFCNTVDMARTVFGLVTKTIRREALAADAVLLTGRMRNREAAAARDIILDPVNGAPAARGGDVPRSRALIVVATQTLEVGADLDFDVLVTESASVRAMTQRLGRVNRFGEKPHARAVICHPLDATEQPPYGDEPCAVWERLSSTSTPLDLSPRRIAGTLGEPADVPERTGILLPAHIWEFAKTADPEPDEAPVELFFRSLDETSAGVTLCWRSYVPGPGTRLVPSLSQDEAIDVPLREVRAALERRSLTTVSRLQSDRATVETIAVSRIRPGDAVVLDVASGLYDEFGWNAKADERVLDVATISAGVLWLDAGVVSSLSAASGQERAPIDRLVRGIVATLDTDAAGRDASSLITELAQTLSQLPPHPWMRADEWAAYCATVRVARLVAEADAGLARLEAPRVPGTRRQSVQVRTDAFDDLSFDVTSAQLIDHLGSVGGAAERIARALGLPEGIVETVRRAGELHDAGKADPRFQRWLDPSGEATELLAKSGASRDVAFATRRASGWPRGGRHEAISGRMAARLVEAPTAERRVVPDLLVHLVLSHHGSGRPFIDPVDDAAPPSVTLPSLGITETGDLSLVDWEQPRRFRRLTQQFGAWGLALLEAVVRQSDHAASGEVRVS